MQNSLLPVLCHYGFINVEIHSKTVFENFLEFTVVVQHSARGEIGRKFTALCRIRTLDGSLVVGNTLCTSNTASQGVFVLPKRVEHLKIGWSSFKDRVPVRAFLSRILNIHNRKLFFICLL